MSYNRYERIPLEVSAAPEPAPQQPRTAWGKLLIALVVTIVIVKWLNGDISRSLEPHGPVEIVQQQEVELLTPYDFEVKKSRDETVCHAQVMFSETDLPLEMSYTGWVVRNRVEAEYRGEDYCEVAYYPWAFSGLNKPQGQRATANKLLQYQTNMVMPELAENWIQAPEGDYRRRAAERWFAAVERASIIPDANPIHNPVPEALWFWSPIAGISMPNWAVGKPAHFVIRQHGTKVLRFAFYTEINGGESYAAAVASLSSQVGP